MTGAPSPSSYPDSSISPGAALWVKILACVSEKAMFGGREAMFDFATFKMSEMIECGSMIRQLGSGVHCMEGAAGRIVRYLYGHFGDRRTGARACGHGWLYQTCPYRGLGAQIKPHP